MTSASPTLGSPGPRIFPTPVFVFEPIPQAITCQPVTLSWFYNGPDGLVDFTATNVGVSQDEPAPPLTSSSSTTRGSFTGTDGKQRRAIPTGAANPTYSITLPIASNVDPTQQGDYIWSAVNIPQGWYQINATMPSQGYTSPSRAFFVHSGNDVSCIAVIPTSSSSSTTASSTSSSSLIPPSASSPAVLPVAGASRVNPGAIAGAVIGGVILVAAVLAAWLCLQRKSKGTGTLASRSPRKWNGLSSVDSRALTSTANPKNYSSYRHQSRSESLGTIPMGASEEAVGMEKSSIYGKYNEPLDGPGVALAAMPVLPQHPRSKANSRSYSVSSSNEYLPHDTGVTPGRRPSVPDSVTGRRSIDSSNTYPPTSPVSPHPHGGRNGPSMAANMGRSQSSLAQSPSSSSPTQSSSSHAFPTQYQQRPAPSPSPQHPASPTGSSSPIDAAATTAAAKKANRTSLGGKKRKPVPAYDPNEDEAASLPVPRVNATPSPSPSFTAPQTPTSVTSGGHYATRSQMGKDSSQHDLVHKSSFGPGGVEGKPLHYLIPDMPMLPKE
ncbi:hypothetical protein CVT26_003898 [Gymnopilus dilepis]|uniref:Uncharacterized protein n=1 Tax=Gymnopilus dilepis TaxID=231916 RepID=A0A409W6X3_9AGAR|nr:hypothetical protein CVT26_003898 [Gymnopilus dilepis]